MIVIEASPMRTTSTMAAPRKDQKRSIWPKTSPTWAGLPSLTRPTTIPYRPA